MSDAVRPWRRPQAGGVARAVARVVHRSDDDPAAGREQRGELLEPRDDSLPDPADHLTGGGGGAVGLEQVVATDGQGDQRRPDGYRRQRASSTSRSVRVVAPSVATKANVESRLPGQQVPPLPVGEVVVTAPEEQARGPLPGPPA